MEKMISVTCECDGRGFIAVADNGGEGVEHVAALIEKAEIFQVDELSTTPDPTAQEPDAQPER